MTSSLGLVSSVGRALHQYYKGHGFKFHTGLNFFRLSFHCCLSSIHYCEDHFNNHFFIHSSNIWFSYIFFTVNYCYRSETAKVKIPNYTLPKPNKVLPLTDAICRSFPDSTIATLISAVPSKSLPTVTSKALLSGVDCSVLSSAIVALLTSNNPGFRNCEPAMKRNTQVFIANINLWFNLFEVLLIGCLVNRVLK